MTTVAYAHVRGGEIIKRLPLTLKNGRIAGHITLTDGSKVSAPEPDYDGPAGKVVPVQREADPTPASGERLGAMQVEVLPDRVSEYRQTEPKPRRAEGTFREFMDLFTPPEQLAIAGAAMSDVAVKLWYDRAMGGNVRLDAAETSQGLAAMVASGLITQARADAILAADYNTV